MTRHFLITEAGVDRLPFKDCTKKVLFCGMEKRNISEREHPVEFALAQLQALHNALMTVIGEARETFDQVKEHLAVPDNQRKLVEMVGYLEQVHARFTAAMPQFDQLRAEDERVQGAYTQVQELLDFIGEFVQKK